MRQIFLAFFIDGDAEGVHTGAFGFDQGLARVFDAVGAAVAVEGLGLNVFR